MKENHKREKITSLLERLAAEYLAKDSSGSLLLTITRAELSDDRNYATIFFTALPEAREAEAKVMLAQEAGSVRHYIDEHAKIGKVPFLHFEVDYGEKNRQKIETLSQIDSKKKKTA